MRNQVKNEGAYVPKTHTCQQHSSHACAREDAVEVRYGQLINTAATRQLSFAERETLRMFAAWLQRTQPQVDADIEQAKRNLVREKFGGSF